jgi:hypothetical protein
MKILWKNKIKFHKLQILINYKFISFGENNLVTKTNRNGVIIMQKINCSVTSCMYNALDENECTLKAIQVCPCSTITSGTPQDETCCASYKDTNK